MKLSMCLLNMEGGITTKEFDTINLRHTADYETNLYHGLQWVPVNCLGKTHFTRNEIIDISKKSTDEKKILISNLYEAIQLLQIGHFKIIQDDATYVTKHGLIWEYHRTGKETFMHNGGCCAAVAAWGCYLLKSCYDQIGIITMNSMSGNGHAVNYIFFNDFYYIFDLYVQSNQFNSDIPIETGNLFDFRRTKWITGIMIKVKELSLFAEFFSRYMYFKSKEYLFLKHEEHECSSVSILKEEKGTTIYIPCDKKIDLISCKNSEKHFQIKRILLSKE